MNKSTKKEQQTERFLYMLLSCGTLLVLTVICAILTNVN